MARFFKLERVQANSEPEHKPYLGLGSNIVNLAGLNLNSDEVSILSKGLKFVPSLKLGDRIDILKAFHEFSRKVKLSYFFHNKPRVEAEKLPFKSKSIWQPDDKLIPIEIKDTLEKLSYKLHKIYIIP